MKLPVDEEYDEKVMCVPKPLKISLSLLLTSVPGHRPKSCPHDPPSDGRACLNTDKQEIDHSLLGGGGRLDSKIDDINNVGKRVDHGPDTDGPTHCLVESDILVERNDCTNRGTTHERDEVSADWEKNEDDIYVAQHCRGTSDS